MSARMMLLTVILIVVVALPLTGAITMGPVELVLWLVLILGCVAAMLTWGRRSPR